MKRNDVQKKTHGRDAQGTPALAVANDSKVSASAEEEFNALALPLIVRKLKSMGIESIPDFKTVDEAIAWMEEHKPSYRRPGEAKSGQDDDLSISSSEAGRIADKLHSFGYGDVPLFRTVDGFLRWIDEAKHKRQEYERLDRRMAWKSRRILMSFGIENVPHFKSMPEVKAWMDKHLHKDDCRHVRMRQTLTAYFKWEEIAPKKQEQESCEPWEEPLDAAADNRHNPLLDDFQALILEFKTRKLKSLGIENLPDFKTLEEVGEWLDEHLSLRSRLADAQSGNDGDLSLSPIESHRTALLLQAMGYQDVPLFETVDDYFIWADELIKKRKEHPLIDEVLPHFQTMDEVCEWLEKHYGRHGRKRSGRRGSQTRQAGRSGSHPKS